MDEVKTDEVTKMLDMLIAWHESEPTSEPGDLLNSHGYPTELALQNIRRFTGTPKEFVEYIDSIWHFGLPPVKEIEDEFGRRVIEVALVTHGWSGNETVVGVVDQTMFGFMYWEMSKRGGLHVYHIPLEGWEHHYELLGTLEHTEEVAS